MGGGWQRKETRMRRPRFIDLSLPTNPGQEKNSRLVFCCAVSIPNTNEKQSGLDRVDSNWLPCSHKREAIPPPPAQSGRGFPKWGSVSRNQLEYGVEPASSPFFIRTRVAGQKKTARMRSCARRYNARRILVKHNVCIICLLEGL